MSPPVLWDIELDPLLAGMLIAEARGCTSSRWASFIGDRWQEWQRPVPRRRAAFPERRQRLGVGCGHGSWAAPTFTITRSAKPSKASILRPAMTLTLNDLVSYNHKHNEANGENNHDGSDNNLSWNCGVEGTGQRSDGRGGAHFVAHEQHRHAGCQQIECKKFLTWRLRSASTIGSSVGPSTPQFQLRLSSEPSRLFSPLASLCLWLYDTRSLRVKPSWQVTKLMLCSASRSSCP